MWNEATWAAVGKPVVDRAKREVYDDVTRGIVPLTVGSFAELHDYVDANGYGGAFENFDGSDASISFWNRVHDEVDAWIKAGGLKEPGNVHCFGYAE